MTFHTAGPLPAACFLDFLTQTCEMSLDADARSLLLFGEVPKRSEPRGTTVLRRNFILPEMSARTLSLSLFAAKTIRRAVEVLQDA